MKRGSRASASSCVRDPGRVAAWLLAAALLAGCAGDVRDGRRPDPSEASAGGAFPDTVRGIVTVQSAGGAAFRPCGASGVYRVLEEPGADLGVAALGLADPGTPLYAELQAQREPAPSDAPGAGLEGVLRVRRWVYLAEDTSGCSRLEARPANAAAETGDAEPLSADVAWRARGNEPFWMAEVRSDRIVVVRPAVDTVSVPPVEPVAEGQARRWRAETEAHELDLVLSEEPCVDSMSGSRFGYTATLTLDGEELRGCARPGPAADATTPAGEEHAH